MLKLPGYCGALQVRQAMSPVQVGRYPTRSRRASFAPNDAVRLPRSEPRDNLPGEALHTARSSLCTDRWASTSQTITSLAATSSSLTIAFGDIPWLRLRAAWLASSDSGCGIWSKKNPLSYWNSGSNRWVREHALATIVYLARSMFRPDRKKLDAALGICTQWRMG